jgi:hypothetical protein
MLQRVSAALSKYLSPIKGVQNSTAGQAVREERSSFDRFKAPKGESKEQESQHQQGQPQAKPKQPKDQAPALAVPPGGDAPAAPPAPAAPSTPGLSVSHAFINLLRTLQAGSGLFRGWLGNGSYKQSLKTRRKAGTVRKGAMLDERVE